MTIQQPILITGANSSTGAIVAHYLIEKGIPVRLALRNPNKYFNEPNPLIEKVYFNYNDKTSVATALQGVKQVFFLTPSTVQARQESLDITELAKEFVKAMKNASIEHIVRVSGMAADKYPEATHYIIEEALRDSAISHTILRPAFFMQIFDKYYINSIKKHNHIPFYDANVRESFIDIRDIAAVAVEALLNPKLHQNKIYTLTSEKLLNYSDIASIFTKALAREISYTAKSDADTLKALMADNWSEEAANSYIGILNAVQDGVFSYTTKDVETVLQRKPYTFEDYVREYAKVFV